MKRFTQLFALFTLAFAMVLFVNGSNVNAQTTEHGPGFVDENGDGYNDNAPDADGDGIPNGQDPDYVKPGDGTGKSAANAGKGFGKPADKGKGTKGFVDENGDGINDNARDADGDGIPNGQDADYVKPDIGPRAGKGKSDRPHGFVDEDGDGINDLALDSDGDGIPNGKDADYVRPLDGTGNKFSKAAKKSSGFGKGVPGQKSSGNAGTAKGPQGQRRAGNCTK